MVRWLQAFTHNRKVDMHNSESSRNVIIINQRGSVIAQSRETPSIQFAMSHQQNIPVTFPVNEAYPGSAEEFKKAFQSLSDSHEQNQHPEA